MIYLLGQRLRELRKNSGFTLRKAAKEAGVDVAVLSKMERGERRFNKNMVIKLAELYQADKDELMVIFLGDKVLYNLKDEEMAVEALKVAEKSLQYGFKKGRAIPEIIRICGNVFIEDGRIDKAWIFGSYARQDQKQESDLDIMIKLKDGVSFSLYDMAEIQHRIEELLEKRVDLVEIESLSPLMLESVNADRIMIYE